jgi:hypothetical protein
MQLGAILRDPAAPALGEVLRTTLIVGGVVVAVRIAWVFSTTYMPWLSRRVRSRERAPSARNVAIIAWTGTRGGDSLVMALAIPQLTALGAPLPGRDLILATSFGVILLTLLAQALTLGPLVRLLHPPPDRSYTAPSADTPNPGARIVRAERFAAASQVLIRHGGDRAYYAPKTDFIQLPPFEAFRDGESYYATLMHELTHAVGHPSRLARDLGKRFGDDAYAAEELIAEIGSAFLCADLGITLEPRDDHASYIATWLKVLRSDSRAIFTAAAQVQRAAQYLALARYKPRTVTARASGAAPGHAPRPRISICLNAAPFRQALARIASSSVSLATASCGKSSRNR